MSGKGVKRLVSTTKVLLIVGLFAIANIERTEVANAIAGILTVFSLFVFTIEHVTNRNR